MVDFIKSFKFDLRYFATTSVAFGVFMMARHGLIGGAISGLLFGLCMSTFKAYFDRDKKLLGVSQMLHIYQPIFLIWILVFLGWTFLFAVFILKKDNPVAIAFMGAFPLVCMLGIYALGKDVIVGQHYLLERRRFPFRRESYYLFSELKDVHLTWYQFIEVRFQNNHVLRFSSSDYKHGELPPFGGETPNPMLEGLLRIQQELERRSRNVPQNIEIRESEKMEMAKLKHPFGWGAFFIMNICTFTLLLSGGVWIQARGLNSLKKTEHPQKLRLHHFENAFFLYRGTEFEDLKSDSIQRCQSKNDYNCRFSYYLLSLEGKTEEGLRWIARSCSDLDPQSCYILYTSETLSVSGKEKAGKYLASYCSREGNSSEACCECYLEHQKSKR